MRTQWQAMVTGLIEENPGVTVPELRELITGIPKGTLCSTLSRLYFLNMVKREKNEYGHFQYWLEEGLPAVMEKVEEFSELSPLPLLKTISPIERKRRIELADSLREKGLMRRADRVLLELLDVTPSTIERERIINLRAGITRSENWQ
jgi:DNA-binding HxlR family transcriptional regulator